MRERPPAPSAEELAAIRALAEDLPALWRVYSTTQEDRQTLVRLSLERLVVEVIGDSEQVRVDCHWQGGGRTQHWIVRPISSSKRLSTDAALITWASELRRAGHDGSEIAAILNREGWRPAKRTDAFTGRWSGTSCARPKPSRPPAGCGRLRLTGGLTSGRCRNWRLGWGYRPRPSTAGCAGAGFGVARLGRLLGPTGSFMPTPRPSRC